MTTLGEVKIHPSDVQYTLIRWIYRPAKAPAIDWEVSIPSKRGIEMFIDGSRMGSDVTIYKDGQFLGEGSFRLSSVATVY